MGGQQPPGWAGDAGGGPSFRLNRRDCLRAQARRAWNQHPAGTQGRAGVPSGALSPVPAFPGYLLSALRGRHCARDMAVGGQQTPLQRGAGGARDGLEPSQRHLEQGGAARVPQPRAPERPRRHMGTWKQPASRLRHFLQRSPTCSWGRGLWEPFAAGETRGGSLSTLGCPEGPCLLFILIPRDPWGARAGRLSSVESHTLEQNSNFKSILTACPSQQRTFFMWKMDDKWCLSGRGGGVRQLTGGAHAQAGCWVPLGRQLSPDVGDTALLHGLRVSLVG